MRTALPTLAGFLMVASLAHGLGGVAVHGAGLGTYQSNDGVRTCAGSPFVVEVLYLPEDKGALHSEFAGSCLGTVGATLILGRAIVNTTRMPPVTLGFFCEGTEATGLHCEGQQGATLITADVSPYAGPGNNMTLSTRGAFRFDGNFTAV